MPAFGPWGCATDSIQPQNSELFRLDAVPARPPRLPRGTRNTLCLQKALGHPKRGLAAEAVVLVSPWGRSAPVAAVVAQPYPPALEVVEEYLPAQEWPYWPVWP